MSNLTASVKEKPNGHVVMTLVVFDEATVITSVGQLFGDGSRHNVLNDHQIARNLDSNVNTATLHSSALFKKRAL